MSPDEALRAAIFLVALAIFGWSCYRRFRFITLGEPDNRFNNIGRRIWYMLLYAFGQKRVVSRPFGVNHFVLFWCFMILLLANTEFLFNGIFPEYISLSKLPIEANYALSFIFDIVSLLALLAVCVAIIRRLAFPPAYIDARSRDAFIILSLVGILMLAFFGLHAAKIKLGQEEAAYMPVSSFVANAFMARTLPVTASYLKEIFWLAHALALLAFLNYLPYSKHMHIMTSIPNCFFRSLDKVTTQPREEFKKGNTFGVGQVDQFTWKGLFDSYSCTECGRCSDVCPATSTGKTLNPRLVIHDIKTNLLHNGPQLFKNGKKDVALPLIGGGHEGSIAEDALWACTTCSACMEVCPVFIEHVPRIVDMRRNLVEMKAKFPEELLSFFENMEQRSNPWGIAPGDRAKWASELDVKHFEAGTEYLFYVGCYGAFDARSRRVSAAVANILNRAGVSWGILGKDELCCGDSLRRLGNEYVFDQMVKANIKLFTDKGIKKVVTQCPHCFSTFKNDYRQYGIELEVIHHTEFIEQLLRDNRLKLNGAVDLGNIVFHDSCYLGRYNQIYQAPRHVISAVTGHKPLEMKRHQENSFCCGAGGGRMWLEESTPKKIYQARTEEALEHDPSAVCVCCPYCMTMFEDGLKDKGALGRVDVLDLAEIVEKAL
ncbi:MAG: (Fe-S)-binding protein [Chloroflexi bacterium]|nr:(Fe-S)-binding protein [Chloroflexota bacterium]MBM3175766.1 (Fe-S)-binding protein [Chloroflexota bacterium]MBM4450922.1 (Fe-S)-binding protein [Chloroflexota bacterium]